jgi:hypothetical protein
MHLEGRIYTARSRYLLHMRSLQRWRFILSFLICTCSFPLDPFLARSSHVRTVSLSASWLATNQYGRGSARANVSTTVVHYCLDLHTIQQARSLALAYLFWHIW